jgi:glycosyltransferase 2 family protein
MTPKDQKTRVLVDRLMVVLQRARELLSWLKDKRWLRISIQVITLFFCGSYLAANLRNLRTATLHINAVSLVSGIVLVLIASFMGAVVWQLILYGLGQPFSWIATMRAHLYANLAKYMPGYAWQLVSKAWLTRQLGVPTDTTGVAMGIELLLTAVAGLVVVLALVPAHLVNQLLLGRYLPLIMRLGSVLLVVGLGALPAVLRVLFRKTGRTRLAQAVNAPALWAAGLVMLLGWLVLGAGYWLLGAALTPLSLSVLPLFCFTLTASFLAGLAVIFVPMGLGVREALMVAILGGALSSSTAVILAGILRLSTTLCELLSLGIVQAFNQRQQAAISPD